MNQTSVTQTGIPEVERFHDEEETARVLLGIATRTLVTRRMRGEVPHVRVGRLVKYYWPDVVAHIRRTAPKHGGRSL